MWGQLQGILTSILASSAAPQPGPLVPQVIGLLDVFTPDESLDDFTDL